MALSNASVSQLSDGQLMEGLRDVARRKGEVTAELLAHLGEVDARRLCDRETEGSLFLYCVKVLNFSEGEAYKRIGAARAARAYPVILEMVARGDLHLTAVRLLAPHLTVENHRALLQAAVRKSKREVEMLIAEWFPQPDAPTLLRKLPEPGGARRGEQPDLCSASASTGRATDTPIAAGAASLATSEAIAGASAPELSGSGGGTSTTSASTGERAQLGTPSRSADRGSVAPLAPGRFRLQVTLSGETRDKLLRAQALLRHAQPDGDLAVVLDRALSCLVDELERRKFGRCKRPEKRERPDAGAEASSRPSTEAALPEAASPVSADPRLCDGEVQLSPEPVERAPASRPGRLSTGIGRDGQVQLSPEPVEGAPASRPGRLSTGTGRDGHVQLSPEPVEGASASRPRQERPGTGREGRAQLSLEPVERGPAPRPGRENRSAGGDRAGHAAGSETIPRAIKRRVAERDGCRCTYVGPDGRRCEEIAFLEYHHLEAQALGGATTVENLALRCGVHNRQAAVEDFGAAKVRGRGRRAGAKPHGRGSVAT